MYMIVYVPPLKPKQINKYKSCQSKVYLAGWWYTYPLKNMSSSVEMMEFPIYIWESHKSHVPNHQPV